VASRDRFVVHDDDATEQQDITSATLELSENESQILTYVLAVLEHIPQQALMQAQKTIARAQAGQKTKKMGLANRRGRGRGGAGVPPPPAGLPPPQQRGLKQRWAEEVIALAIETMGVCFAFAEVQLLCLRLLFAFCYCDPKCRCACGLVAVLHDLPFSFY
jgi:hypothetical protein